MRRMTPFDLVFGRYGFKASLADGARLLNLFRMYGIVYRDFGEDGEGNVCFTVGLVARFEVISVCRKNRINIEKTRAFGVPHLLYSYRKRWGLAVGAIIAAFIMLVSDDYLWDIRVTGNEKLTYSYVVEALAENGFSVGSRLDGLDIDRTETLTLLNSEGISWMSINMNGTVAEVQIRESAEPPEKTEMRPANIIAARDGQIEYFEIFSGEPAVKAGSAVRRGDLLVSGVRDRKNGGFSLTRAEGRVFALTERHFEVSVPLEYSRKTVKESRTVGKYINFFSKEIKIFKRDTPNGENCDTIDNVEVLRFFGGVKLPIGIRTVSAIISEEKTERRTDAEAMEIAYYQLSREMDRELSEAQILKKTVEFELTEDSYILRCTVRCIENIGQISEFDAE